MSTDRDAVWEEIAGTLHAAGHPDWSPLTDLLLPVVDRIASERAAAELEAAADAADTRGLDRAADHAANWLRTRAAALRASNGAGTTT